MPCHCATSKNVVKRISMAVISSTLPHANDIQYQYHTPSHVILLNYEK